MGLFKHFYPKDSVKRKILNIEEDIKRLVKPLCEEKFGVIWYGAYDIDPKYLVYWVCVQSDKMQTELADNEALKTALRELLTTHQYPEHAYWHVHFSFASQETVDRVAGGNWYHFFK